MENAKLTKTAVILVILSSLVFLADTAREFIGGLKAGVTAIGAPQSLELESMASTNLEHASVTLTNTHGFTAQARCFFPVVANSAIGKKVIGAVVCSGELKAKTTVTLTAPYAPGAVLEICGRDEQYARVPDWSKCAFTLEAKGQE